MIVQHSSRLPSLSRCGRTAALIEGEGTCESTGVIAGVIAVESAEQGQNV